MKRCRNEMRTERWSGQEIIVAGGWSSLRSLDWEAGSSDMGKSLYVIRPDATTFRGRASK